MGNRMIDQELTKSIRRASVGLNTVHELDLEEVQNLTAKVSNNIFISDENKVWRAENSTIGSDSNKFTN